MPVALFPVITRREAPPGHGRDRIDLVEKAEHPTLLALFFSLQEVLLPARFLQRYYFGLGGAPRRSQDYDDCQKIE